MKKEGGREAGYCLKMVPDRGDVPRASRQCSPGTVRQKLFQCSVRHYSISIQTADPPHFSLPTTFKLTVINKITLAGRIIYSSKPMTSLLP
jgi:hypothetical protein